MVNIRELRIGNWVRIVEPDKYVGAAGTIQTLSSLEGSYFTININDSNFGYLHTDVFCEDLESIPLTAEILEKNDWLYQKYPDDEQFIWPFDSEIKMPFRLLVGLDGNSYWVTAGMGGLVCPVNYVHQLQNILIDMGIDKEIIL